MTFDETIKYAKEIAFVQSYEDVYEYNRVIDLDDMIELLENLKKEYASTVEMTEREKDTLLEYVCGDSGNFFDFVEYETDYLYKKLSTSELMQAWLHPETIKIIDE